MMNAPLLSRLPAIHAVALVLLGCAPSATDTASVGHILDPLGGCSAVGAWNISGKPDAEGRVRFELLVGSNRSVSEFEVDCDNLELRQTANIPYNQAGEAGTHRKTDNAVASDQLASALRQFCAISRGEARLAHGTFTSVADFRRKSAALPRAYFAGQPACATYSGPPTIMRPAE
jgi:hypothetical protein